MLAPYRGTLLGLSRRTGALPPAGSDHRLVRAASPGLGSDLPVGIGPWANESASLSASLLVSSPTASSVTRDTERGFIRSRALRYWCRQAVSYEARRPAPTQGTKSQD